MRVLAAMSGGVDSSVAAALMVERGHEVIGVTLKLWEGPNGEAPTAGCCTVSDAEDARRVAAQLDIPYYVLDYTDEFRAAVVDRFVSDYAHGRTPNPCVECNRVVKFDRLVDQAVSFGCDLVVTGHYARVHATEAGYELLRAVDLDKDQSYVLYMLGQEELARVRFPVGESTKAETRRRAEELGLRTAHKPESQDICFVGERDYREFLRERSPDLARPGLLLDTAGDVLGTHGGVIDFTIGQRRGLGVALGERRYVVDVRPKAGTVVVGRREELLTGGCRVAEVSWVEGRPPGRRDVQVKVRYRSLPVPSRLVPDAAGSRDHLWTVRFVTPQPAVAPGQAAVFYEGDRVLGGGTIAERLDGS
jgi:tRNA-specific 2-thiouridylase